MFREEIQTNDNHLYYIIISPIVLKIDFTAIAVSN